MGKVREPRAHSATTRRTHRDDRQARDSHPPRPPPIRALPARPPRRPRRPRAGACRRPAHALAARQRGARSADARRSAMAVGAAIGPAPSSSLAGTSDLPLLLRALGALEAAQTGEPPSTPAHFDVADGRGACSGSLAGERRAGGRRHAPQPASSTSTAAPSAAAPAPRPQRPRAEPEEQPARRSRACG